MMPLQDLADLLFSGQKRVTVDELQRRAVVAELPSTTLALLDGLPEGEYDEEEFVAGLRQLEPATAEADEAVGVPPEQLGDGDLFRAIASLHRTRLDTMRYGSDQALARHTERLADLEVEYLRRFPQREIDPERERGGARER